MDIFDFPYFLIKIGEINDDIFVSPILYLDMTIQNNELWNEFIEINDHYTIRQSVGFSKQIECEVYGHEIWGLLHHHHRAFAVFHGQLPSVGESFVLRSKTSSGIRTSTVTDILSDNIFITMNSVYFLVDDSWRKKQNRDKKINEIINGKI
jgi:hypothetical protein